MNQENSKMNNDPVVLITGSARRIGAETARLLHKNGYRIIIHCNRSIDDANLLADELNTLRTDSAIVISVELGTTDGCNFLMQQVLSKENAFCGRLDVLINNASAFYPIEVADVTDQQWKHLFSINLHSPFLLAQKAEEELKARNGCIINITDIHGDRPLKGYAVYSMTKAGLISMTKALAKEFAPKIRVNGVSPGAILWPESEMDDHEKQAKVLAKIPLGRMGAARNIAGSVLFLIQHSYVTGQIIKVDGGRSI